LDLVAANINSSESFISFRDSFMDEGFSPVLPDSSPCSEVNTRFRGSFVDESFSSVLPELVEGWMGTL